MKPSTLLKLIWVALLILLQYVMYSSSSDKPGKKAQRGGNCLEIEGKIEKTNGTDADTYTVNLLSDNKPIESLTIKEGHSFKFSLQGNNWYAVEIKREGCVPKLISINTQLPKHLYNMLRYKLYCTIAEPLEYEEAKHLDEDTIDFPAAIVSFDNRLDAFYVNEDYYSNIRKRLVESLVRQ